MTVSRKVELISGITTGLLALAVSGTLAPPLSVLQFLRLLAFYLGPALLVAVGAYVHAVRGQRWGFVILLVGGVILAGIGFIVTLFGGLFYFYGLWGGLLRLAPSTMAILTMVASLLARRSAADN
jgi:hypothetical protein